MQQNPLIHDISGWVNQVANDNSVGPCPDLCVGYFLDYLPAQLGISFEHIVGTRIYRIYLYKAPLHSLDFCAFQSELSYEYLDFNTCSDLYLHYDLDVISEQLYKAVEHWNQRLKVRDPQLLKLIKAQLSELYSHL